MKIHRIFGILIVVMVSMISSVSATDVGLSILPNLQRTVTIQQKTYTLNICNTQEVSGFRSKVLLATRGSSLQNRRRVLNQIKLLQVFWNKTCNETAQSGPSLDSGFVAVTNPEFLETLSSRQRTIARSRASLYINAAESVVDTMIQRGVLTQRDKQILRGKIVVQYVNNCKQIDGLTTVKQRYNQDQEWLRNDLLSILLNVSACELEAFSSLFTTSYRHVLIHELGHYIYYFRDKNPQQFENICRENNQRKNTCLADETFYTKYAMTDPQEDYAETFAHRYQQKKPEFSLNTPNINFSILNQKDRHFATLFSQ